MNPNELKLARNLFPSICCLCGSLKHNSDDDADDTDIDEIDLVNCEYFAGMANISAGMAGIANAGVSYTAYTAIIGAVILSGNHTGQPSDIHKILPRSLSNLLIKSSVYTTDDALVRRTIHTLYFRYIAHIRGQAILGIDDDADDTDTRIDTSGTHTDVVAGSVQDNGRISYANGKELVEYIYDCIERLEECVRRQAKSMLADHKFTYHVYIEAECDRRQEMMAAFEHGKNMIAADERATNAANRPEADVFDVYAVARQIASHVDRREIIKTTVNIQTEKGNFVFIYGGGCYKRVE